MKFISTIVGFVLFVLFFGFALKNTQEVDLHLFLNYELRGPLVLMLLAFFVSGAALGILAVTPTVFRHRRENKGHAKTIEELQAIARRGATQPQPDVINPQEEQQQHTQRMDYELWWLLAIPVVFGLGWVAARVDIRSLLSEARTLPRGYFKGLNFLLNDQPDKAIDAFIEILQLDPETADLHFALGNLFRRRGEIERAIRVHQNLLARPDLPQEQQAHARYELGMDYLKAGLLDRAEETFNQLLDTQYASQSRRALLEIFQREKEWKRAIESAQGLQETGAGARQKEISQFYCELAQDALVHMQTDEALALLERALATDRKNVRATLLIGDAQLARGDIEGAIMTWRRVEQQSVPHVALVAQRLMDGYRAVGRPQEGVNVLRAYLNEASSIDLVEVVFKAVHELDGVEAAHALVKEELKRNPTLLGLDKLLEARMMDAPPHIWEELTMVKNLVHGYTQKLSRYQCSHCGFKARQYYWQCPGCSRWETYPPRRTEELNVIN